MIGDIMQPTHLLFVLVIALLVLGPKRLPEVGRQLGNGIRDFRAAINGERNEHHDEVPSGQATSPAEHQFAHAAPEPAQGEHEFAHAPTEAATSEGQAPDAGTEQQSAQTTVTDASPSASEHEFAYETSQPAEKPGDSVG